MAEDKDRAIAPSGTSLGSSGNGSNGQKRSSEYAPPAQSSNGQNSEPIRPAWNTATPGTYVYAQSAPPGEGEQKVAEEDSEKSNRRRWLWIAAAALALLAIFFIYRFIASRSAAAANKAAAEAKQQAGAAITVGEAKTGDINIYVDALGTVTPLYTVTLYSQITGQVTAVHYREGQMVNKGDPLIDIDQRPYETTLTQAEGNLERDQGLLAEARMDLQRYETAFAKNAIARQQVEDQAQIVVQDQGTVKADEGTVAYDRVQLSYCHIVSPISGQVGLRLVDPGNTVFAGSGSTLVVITQLQPITVVFNVSEDDIPQIQTQLRGGHALQVDAFDRAYDKVIESGNLTSVDNEVDTTTGTIKFRAQFPNKNLSLYPNQFVNARLLVTTLRKVTLIPSAAVQQNGTNAFVYLVKPGNTVAVQQIKTLANTDQETAVQGVNAGATIAISGFDRLENGVKVSYGQSAPADNQGNAQKQQNRTAQTNPAKNNSGLGNKSSPGGGKAP